jgi:hypothetical protein
LEYIRSCEEIWAKGLFVQLGAYQHHAFLDWRIVEPGDWGLVYEALNGTGVPSMQGKWEEMFGVKEAVVEEKVKKPAKKRTTKKNGEKEIITKKKVKSAAKNSKE